MTPPAVKAPKSWQTISGCDRIIASVWFILNTASCGLVFEPGI
jgi:hypothetical protein